MESFNHVFFNFRGVVLQNWLKEHIEIPVAAIVLYLVLVLYVPKYIMAQRAPMNLTVCNILWNLLLTVFSIAGAYYCVPRILESVWAPQISNLLPHTNEEGPHATAPVLEGSLYTSTCVWNERIFYDGPVGFWVFAFVISKIPEMIDTAFLVLQKKPLIFLHCYHHLTVLIFVWTAYTNAISCGLWFAAMNYSVHSVMYLYYFVCACGYRNVVRPIAPLITSVQILQMMAGTFIVIYAAVIKYVVGKDCAVDNISIQLSLFFYVTYFMMFARLFYRRYICPPVNKKDSNVDHGEKKIK